MVCPVSVVTGTPGKAVPRIHSWEWLVQLGALLCEPRRQLQFRAGLWWLNKMLHPCLERRKTGVILPFWKIPHFKYKYANVIHCAPFNMLRIAGHRKYLGSISVTDIIYISTVNLWIIYGEILKDMPHLLKGCPMFERRLRMGHTEWERSHTEVFVGHKVAEKFPLSELPSQCTAHKWHGWALVPALRLCRQWSHCAGPQQTPTSILVYSTASKIIGWFLPLPDVYKERMNLRSLDLPGVYWPWPDA